MKIYYKLNGAFSSLLVHSNDHGNDGGNKMLDKPRMSTVVVLT